MTIMSILGIFIIVVLLFLYVSLKHDVKELRKQVAYSNHRKSKFRFYTTSFDSDMKKIMQEMNEFRDEQIELCNTYQRKDQDFKDMITSISHDIRTPLTSIHGYIQLLEECEKEADAKRYYVILHQRIAYLKELLEELFLYTKIVNNNITYVMEPIEVYELVCETLLYYHLQLQEKQIMVSVDFEDEQVILVSDAIYLRRILNNLCQNTVRHGENFLHIIQCVQKDNLVLCFANQVSEDTLNVEELFQRFYTGDQARSKQNSGLGLAIVKELAETLGGKVEAKLETACLNIYLSFPISQ